MPTVTRTNLCTNGSFEAGITGWTAFGLYPPTLTASTAQALNRTHSLLVTWATAGGTVQGAQMTWSGLTVGLTYTFSASIYTPSGGQRVIPVIAEIGVGAASSAVLNSWNTPISYTFTATATNHTVQFWPNASTTAGQQTYLDAVLFEQAPNAASYFDGASLGCPWTGTANLSTSQQLSGPPSITVTADPVNEPPRYILYVTGAPGTTAQVTRTDIDGTARPVRGGDPAPLIGGQWVGYDYEAPYGTTPTFTVIPSDTSPNMSVTVGPLATTQSRLIHPGVPGLSVQIDGYHQDSARASDGGEAAHVVLGRENPIIITDGQRKGRTYQASVRTQTETDNAALRAILSQSVPPLLQVVYPFTAVGQWEYVSVGHVDEQRVTELFSDPKRIFSMLLTVVDRPTGGIAAQRTIADVAVEVGTIADLSAKYATITGLLTGIPGT